MDLNSQEWQDLSNEFNRAMNEIEQHSENKWNALSKEDQLDYFCAVVRRIHKGEVEDSRSYRGVLYDVFGFGPEAYAPAQMAGYLDIHNLIYDSDYEHKLLCKYGEYVAEKLGHTLDDPGQFVADFLLDKKENDQL